MTEEIINETNIMALWRKHLDDSSTMEVKEWMARRDMLLEIRERYFPSEHPVEPEPEAKQLTTEEVLWAKIKELEDKITAMSQGAHKASEAKQAQGAHKASEAKQAQGAHSQPGAHKASGAQQTKEATPQSGEVLEAPSGEQFIITPPPMLVQVIKTTCSLVGDQVYCNDELVSVHKQIDPDTRVKYPKEYIRAVLLDEKPDISFLFVQKPDGVYRADHPFWAATQKDTKVTKSNVCGVTITFVGASSGDISKSALDHVTIDGDRVLYRGKEDKAFLIGGKVYSASYLRHLKEGTPKKKPLSLFYRLNDQVIRSEHKCWGIHRLQRVAESVSINDTRMHVSELLKAKQISEKQYIKLLADNVFTVEDGQLLFAGKPYTTARKFAGLTIMPETILEIKYS